MHIYSHNSFFTSPVFVVCFEGLSAQLTLPDLPTRCHEIMSSYSSGRKGTFSCFVANCWSSSLDICFL